MGMVYHDGCTCSCVPHCTSSIIYFSFQSFSSSHITTYKELCSLASDLNQPDLVYKFMHLANHHALWNSKKVIGKTVFILSVLITAQF